MTLPDAPGTCVNISVLGLQLAGQGEPFADLWQCAGLSRPPLRMMEQTQLHIIFSASSTALFQLCYERSLAIDDLEH